MDLYWGLTSETYIRNLLKIYVKEFCPIFISEIYFRDLYQRFMSDIYHVRDLC